MLCYYAIHPVLGITLLKVAEGILPLLNLLLYSTQGSHYSTYYSTQEVAGVTKNLS